MFVPAQGDGREIFMDFDMGNFIGDLGHLIAIKSVKGNCGEISDEYPLGKGIADALKYLLSLGEKFGMKTKNLDNCCGYIEIGEGEKLLGILVHADTVDAGDNWTHAPFMLTLDGDKIYGRGIADDKGGALITLYAMKYLKENNLIKDKRVRLIIGGDEESGEWECIKLYKKTEEIPDIAFSPDGHYPVIYAEKGILKIKISKENDDKEFVFSGGKTVNAVPDFAECTYRGKNYTEKGKTAHSMKPYMGVNAVLNLGKQLETNGISNSFTKLLASANPTDWDIAFCDRPSGELTVNPSVAKVHGRENYLICDIRYPVTCSADEIMEAISKKVSKLGYKAEALNHQKPLYIEKDSHLISTLLSVYNEITGEDAKPVSMGGGTYARAFPNAAAFGTHFPDTESVEHQPDEYWKISDIEKNFKILSEAIKRL